MVALEMPSHSWMRSPRCVGLPKDFIDVTVSPLNPRPKLLPSGKVERPYVGKWRCKLNMKTVPASELLKNLYNRNV